MAKTPSIRSTQLTTSNQYHIKSCNPKVAERKLFAITGDIQNERMEFNKGNVDNEKQEEQKRRKMKKLS